MIFVMLIAFSYLPCQVVSLEMFARQQLHSYFCNSQ